MTSTMFTEDNKRSINVEGIDILIILY
jgi:hypothetical protein